mmetsp:Transcript_37823/g.49790  ORF Transcript_37823/g.49790 Transcript_37823/m.49790 type:complete len:144 (-) Transcript_37823:90-521(-)
MPWRGLPSNPRVQSNKITVFGCVKETKTSVQAKEKRQESILLKISSLLQKCMKMIFKEELLLRKMRKKRNQMRDIRRQRMREKDERRIKKSIKMAFFEGMIKFGFLMDKLGELSIEFFSLYVAQIEKICVKTFIDSCVRVVNL